MDRPVQQEQVENFLVNLFLIVKGATQTTVRENHLDIVTRSLTTTRWLQNGIRKFRGYLDLCLSPKLAARPSCSSKFSVTFTGIIILKAKKIHSRVFYLFHASFRLSRRHLLRETTNSRNFFSACRDSTNDRM